MMAKVEEPQAVPVQASSFQSKQNKLKKSPPESAPKDNPIDRILDKLDERNNKQRVEKESRPPNIPASPVKDQSINPSISF